MPFTSRQNRFWTANSWDQTQIPKPWAKAAIAIGEPMTVPGDVGRRRYKIGAPRPRIAPEELEQNALALLNENPNP